jgi:hypothetical protein
MFATRRCLPFSRFEAKTQSPGCEYGVFCFQQRMNSASNEWSGTGPFKALVLGKPTWPHVQVRRTWIIASAKLTSSHCKPRHSEMRRPCQLLEGSEYAPALGRLHMLVRELGSWLRSRWWSCSGRSAPGWIPEFVESNCTAGHGDRPWTRHVAYGRGLDFQALLRSSTSSASSRLPVVRYRVRFWCPILAASDSAGLARTLLLWYVPLDEWILNAQLVRVQRSAVPGQQLCHPVANPPD